ncbi:hypothetical protein Q1J45_04000 [Pseudomonas rhodesiae]|uniref:hypothetical protein n=1 Tax=unclassified Pseudomonas TaxID=196821 RepID=UPI002736DBCA|nr:MULTISPECIES: hypothetical protein [unclassified Pseudomonas]WLH39637.1 hypothetical protein PSH94_18840 [Pseudomonas sp. FP2254]
MTTRPKPTLNLRSLILIFVLFSAVATLANSFWVMFKIQKQELIENALDANQAYAARIARSVEQVLNADLDKLKYGSAGIGKTFGDNSALTREAKRLVEQDASFNSVLVADANGTIVASAPRKPSAQRPYVAAQRAPESAHGENQQRLQIHHRQPGGLYLSSHIRCERAVPGLDRRHYSAGAEQYPSSPHGHECA